MAKYLDQTGLKYFWRKIKGHCTIPLGIFRRITTAEVSAGSKLYLRFDEADIYDNEFVKFTKDADGYGAITCAKNCKVKAVVLAQAHDKSESRAIAFGIHDSTSGTPTANCFIKQYTEYSIAMSGTLIMDMVAGRKYYLYFGGSSAEKLTGAKIYLEKING